MSWRWEYRIGQDDWRLLAHTYHRVYCTPRRPNEPWDLSARNLAANPWTAALDIACQVPNHSEIPCDLYEQLIHTSYMHPVMLIGKGQSRAASSSPSTSGRARPARPTGYSTPTRVQQVRAPSHRSPSRTGEAIITSPRGRTDPCLCNSRTWAKAEPAYTPAGLYEYYRVVGNTVFHAFFQRKSLGYQLIQAGFPRVEGPTNFEGDSLKDQDGNDLLSPPGVTSDDIDGVIQTETVLEEGREGRFVDPTGATMDPVAARLFVPQHSGLGRLPEDDSRPDCDQAVSVGVGTPPAALFPIATNTQADQAHQGCPNRWAVEEGTLHSQLMGFQTQNLDTVTSPGDLESTLWNLTRWDAACPGTWSGTHARYLECGVLAHGFARVRCESCKDELLVAF